MKGYESNRNDVDGVSMTSFGKLGVPQGQQFVVKCEQCGATPYGTGRLCRSCRRRGMVKAAAITFMVAEGGFLAALAVTHVELPKMPVQQAQADIPAPVAVAANTGWKSFDTQDSANGVMHHAMLQSSAPTVDGKDPYLQGITVGTLELTSSKADGKAVTISFAKVNEECAKHRCSLSASFDETQTEKFAYVDMSDQSNTVLKLADYDRFTQRLSVSHDLTLLASLNGGRPSVLRFTVAGYDTAALHQRLVIRLAALQPQAGRPYPG
jgi:hypothetical protein